MRAREAVKLKIGDKVYNKHTNMIVTVLRVEQSKRSLPSIVYVIHTVDRLHRGESWTHVYFQKLNDDLTMP